MSEHTLTTELQDPHAKDPHAKDLPAPAPARTPEDDDGGGILGILERIGSVVVPVGVALYAVLYLGMEQVYWVFGINPQQAGIDQSVLLGRLLGTLILLLLSLIPALCVLVGLGWLIDRATRGGAGRLVGRLRERPWVVAALAALWSGATYWGLFNLVADLTLGIMVAVAVGLGVLAFLVPFRLLRRRRVGRAGMKVLVAALTGLGLGFVLILSLIEGAVEVRDTGQASDLLGYVGFQDQWAVLRDAENDKPLYDGRWMMLLGESDGTYVFYDCDKQETFRRPMETTNLGDLRLDPDREPGFRCGTLAEPAG
ncbi:hypothetical protein MF672_045305 [Actinomadura sp. ATCC 31491]|uniref:Uncharacterized protein n=1 Tax=Actinomadura luzonensis TaxID=2805427 RepID=A0ABT0G8R6_9ACTN|nr:hypothetical protein [Actinomadura luzonensis]MCK2220976.1 hypothetical protein [Actinomadura luzonensis]